MQNNLSTRNFEYQRPSQMEYERGVRTAELALELGKTAMLFSRVERVPRYADGKRENDAEHSFMVALVAPEIANALQLPLEPGLLSQYAVVHDLIEIKTNDIATFHFDEADQANKERLERIALEELINELPPHTANLLVAYEAQADPESRFVRYIDKLLPIVIDIVGAGKRVLEEDYQVTSLEMLQVCHQKLHDRLVKKFGGEFPEVDLAHQLLCELFEATYEESI